MTELLQSIKNLTDCEEDGLEILGRVAGAGTQAAGRHIRQQKEIFHLSRLLCQHSEGTELIVTDYMQKITPQLGANLQIHQACKTPKQMSKDGNHTTVLAVILYSNRGA